MIWLWVAVGSGIGGAFRYLTSGLVAGVMGETFPWGTLVVNVVGSALLGFFITVTGPDGRFLVGPAERQFVALGLFGGFTTFSSFSVQTLTLMQGGEWVAATGNVVGSVVLCLAGAWLGANLGMLVNR